MIKDISFSLISNIIYFLWVIARRFRRFTQIFRFAVDYFL